MVSSLCSKLYVDNDRETRKSIIVAGTARSGTTWLADIIASQLSCRLMFEPFHPKKVAEYRDFNYFQYVRPLERNDRLFGFSSRVLSGEIRHPWIDREVSTLFPEYRLIKEIRANLFLKWLNNSFPEVPILFIMRHPCAVVLSRMELGWAPQMDIDPLLSQPQLIQDFLSDKMDILLGAETNEEKHALIWSVSNLVPLRQFDQSGLRIIFYEHLCLQPERELPKIFQALNGNFSDSAFSVLAKPSTTAHRASAAVNGADRVTRWMKELTALQVRRILSIVDRFGLDYLYGDSSTPQVDVSS